MHSSKLNCPYAARGERRACKSIPDMRTLGSRASGATGMVFHMYTSAMGLALSETVLVNEYGAQRLTRLERKLYHLG